jgi:hypothetical protein
LYFKETEELNNTEIKLLRAIHAQEKQLSSKDTIIKYNLGTSANVIKAKRSLIAKELLDETQKQLFFLDPVFELWFAQNMIG